MFLHILENSLRNSILITGLVIVMMMIIEVLNIGTRGRFVSGLNRNKVGGVFVGALLGVIPGCMGGFAAVSLYSHSLLSFGALVAMMIASAGDESFVMLATIPKESLWIFSILFVIAVVSGLAVDFFLKDRKEHMHCYQHYDVHKQDSDGGFRGERHFSWKRALMFGGVAVFAVALAAGMLEHEHAGEAHEHIEGGINILSEEWMNILFAIFCAGVLVILCTASDHFVNEHLFKHVVRGHLGVVFAWTFGVLILLGVLLNYFDISNWISSNTALMILLAAAVGFIPESGPHLIFVTLYASGIVPLPVLLASCISQDGHASLPLLAESKRSFVRAKFINCAIAVAVGFAAMLFV